MEELKSFEFNLRTRTVFGVGAAINLGKYLKELSFKRVGIIVDSGIFNQKYVKEILENVQKEDFSNVKIWEYNLNAEPDYDSLDRIKLNFLDGNSPVVDCFVGIGGGSVIDFAKGLSTVVVNPGPAIKYRGFPTGINLPLPTIAIPTTAGTGSEVTYNAVFIDLKEKKKMGINTLHNFPVLAILDPTLTLSCPKSFTVSTGMDALVHTLESYAANKSNPLTRVFAKEAFKLIFNSLYKVLDDPQNIKIRANLQLGAYLAGVSLFNAGSGPAGALSYVLGVKFKVPHGIAGGVFLPHLIEHNVKKEYDYSELYDLIENVDTLTDIKEKNKLFYLKIFELCNKLGVPSGLGVFGVNEDNIKILLEGVEQLGGAFAQNPVIFSVDDGKNILIKMIKNKESNKE